MMACPRGCVIWRTRVASRAAGGRRGGAAIQALVSPARQRGDGGGSARYVSGRDVHLRGRLDARNRDVLMSLNNLPVCLDTPGTTIDRVRARHPFAQELLQR